MRLDYIHLIYKIPKLNTKPLKPVQVRVPCIYLYWIAIRLTTINSNTWP